MNEKEDQAIIPMEKFRYFEGCEKALRALENKEPLIKLDYGLSLPIYLTGDAVVQRLENNIQHWEIRNNNIEEEAKELLELLNIKRPKRSVFIVESNEVREQLKSADVKEGNLLNRLCRIFMNLWSK